MRRAVLIAVSGLVLAGCLEEVDPISNVGGLATPGSVTLTWQPPTHNSDGSSLLDLSGYTIYVGASSSIYEYREIRIDNPGLTAYVVDSLEPGTYYFAATAFNSSGVESALSEEIVRNVK